MSLADRAIEAIFRPQPQHGMVVARIGYGGVLFAAYALRWPRFAELFGPSGVGGADLAARAPLFESTRSLEQSFGWLRHVSSPELVWALYGLLLVCALAFAAGYRTRLAGSLLLGLHILFQARNYGAFSDWAVMIKPWLLYVILSDAGRYFSVDAWRRGGSPPADRWMGRGWPVRLLQIHLCTMYAAAGWGRLVDPAWLRGEMIYQVLTDRWWARVDFDWTPFQPLLRLGTWGVFLLEPLAPFLLFLPRVGVWCCLALMGLHLGLEVLANADMWQPMMLATLAVFLPTSWLEKLFSVRLGWLPRTRSSETT